MTNMLVIFQTRSISDLEIPQSLKNKIAEQNIHGLNKLYSKILPWRVNNAHLIPGFSTEEMALIYRSINDLLSDEPQKNVSVHPSITLHRQQTPTPNLNKQMVNWEVEFTQKFGSVELISEAIHDRSQIEQIAKEFRGILYDQGGNVSGTLRIISRTYPATFLIFMVGSGLYTDKQSYWDTIRGQLSKDQRSIPSINSTDWGIAVEKNLQKFGKSCFDDLRGEANRYVSMILMHSGFQKRSLNDLFDHIVMPVVRHEDMWDMSLQEVIDDALNDKYMWLKVDDPVMHFLKYGGAIAKDFFGRTIRLVKSWNLTGSLLTPEEVGLPAHVIEQFEIWSKTYNRDQSRAGRGLRKPKLYFDPFSYGLYILLPQQPIDSADTSEMSWKLTIDGNTNEYQIRSEYSNGKYQAKQIFIPITSAISEVDVELILLDRTRTWKIGVFKDNSQILIFNGSDGGLQPQLLVGDNLVIRPSDHKLISNHNSSEMIEDYEAGLNGYIAELWDCVIGDTLEDVITEEKMVVTTSDIVARPYFEGSKLVDSYIEETHLPVFTGVIPALVIPDVRVADLDLEKKRWKLRYGSRLNVENNVEFEELTFDNTDQSKLEYDGEKFTIHLSEIFGQRIAGIFSIYVDGPLARDTAMQFGLVPKFELIGLRKTPYLPNDNTQIKLSARYPENGSLKIKNVLSSIKQVTRTPGSSILDVSESVQRLDLGLSIQSITGVVDVPIQYAIDRVRWRLLDPVGEAQDWLLEPTRFSLDVIKRSDSPILVLDLPYDLPEGIDVKFQLLNEMERVIQTVEKSNIGHQRKSRYWRIDLKQFFANIDQDTGSLFAIKAEYKVSGEIIGFPMVVISREIELANFQAAIFESDHDFVFETAWEAAHQLGSRSFLLWNKFAPWRQPYEVEIPDHIVDEFDFGMPKEKVSVGLCFQMVVRDPWRVNVRPVKPKLAMLNCKNIFTIEEMNKIADRLIKQTNSIESVLEAINIYKEVDGEFLRAIVQLKIAFKSAEKVGIDYLDDIELLLKMAKNHDLTKAFVELLFSPTNLEMTQTEIKGDVEQEGSFTRLIKKYLPQVQNLSGTSAEVLVKFPDKIIFDQAIQVILKNNMNQAIEILLKEFKSQKLSENEVLNYLIIYPTDASTELRKFRSISDHAQHFLSLVKNSMAGNILVSVGTNVLTDAGWSKIESIVDPNTKQPVPSFVSGTGMYILVVTHNQFVDPDFVGEKAEINMVEMTMRFNTHTGTIFKCPICNEFATSKRDIFKQHPFSAQHPPTPTPTPIGANVISLTKITFSDKGQ